jgi:hypothetical protein
VAYVIKLKRVQIPRSSPLVIWLHIATTLIHHSGCCGRWYHHDCLQNLVSSGGTLCPVCRYHKKSRFLQLLLYIRAPLPSNLLSLALWHQLSHHQRQRMSLGMSPLAVGVRYCFYLRSMFRLGLHRHQRILPLHCIVHQLPFILFLKGLFFKLNNPVNNTSADLQYLTAVNPSSTQW